MRRIKYIREDIRDVVWTEVAQLFYSSRDERYPSISIGGCTNTHSLTPQSLRIFLLLLRPGLPSLLSSPSINIGLRWPCEKHIVQCFFRVSLGQ